MAMALMSSSFCWFLFWLIIFSFGFWFGSASGPSIFLPALDPSPTACRCTNDAAGFWQIDMWINYNLFSFLLEIGWKKSEFTCVRNFSCASLRVCVGRALSRQTAHSHPTANSYSPSNHFHFKNSKWMNKFARVKPNTEKNKTHSGKRCCWSCCCGRGGGWTPLRSKSRWTQKPTSWRRCFVLFCNL